MNEIGFYTPVKKYFENKVASNMGSEIKISETHRPFPEDIGMAFVGVEKILDFFSSEPDLIGTVHFQRKELKLLTVNIKTKPLTLSDISRTRLYSEVIKSDYSFLISTHDFRKEDKELLDTSDFVPVKNYYLSSNGKYFKKKIIIGKIEYEEQKGEIEIKTINFDTKISSL